MLSINNLHWNQYWYENQASVWSIRNLQRMACKMKCQVILWEDTWVKAKGSLKWSSRCDILFHNLSQTASAQLCVHSVFAHSKPMLQTRVMAVTTLLPTTAAVYATRHQCRQADTATALFPCVCKCNKPNLLIAQSAVISSTLIYLLSSQVAQVREIY